MTKDKHACPHGLLFEDECELCLKEARILAKQKEIDAIAGPGGRSESGRLVNLEAERRRNDILEDDEKPAKALNSLRELNHKAQGKGKLEDEKRVETRVLPPPSPRSFDTEKRQRVSTTRTPKPKKRKPTPPQEPPPITGPIKDGSCLVSDCEHQADPEKRGLCGGCYTMMAHWNIRGKDPQQMQSTPSKAQLETFWAHFND